VRWTSLQRKSSGSSVKNECYKLSNNYGQAFEVREEFNDYTIEVNDHYYASQEYIPEAYFDHLRNENVELSFQGRHVEVNDFALR